MGRIVIVISVLFLGLLFSRNDAYSYAISSGAHSFGIEYKDYVYGHMKDRRIEPGIESYIDINNSYRGMDYNINDWLPGVEEEAEVHRRKLNNSLERGAEHERYY